VLTRSGKGPRALTSGPLSTLRALADDVLRRVRRRVPYTAEEVRTRLRGTPSPSDPRTAAVHAAAAEIATWMYLLSPEADREDHLGLAARRLPTVVFWYCRGMSANEIARRLTPFGDSCYGDRAIDAACMLIAEVLISRATRERARRTLMRR
jgi:hypothetical protein